MTDQQDILDRINHHIHSVAVDFDRLAALNLLEDAAAEIRLLRSERKHDDPDPPELDWMKSIKHWMCCGSTVYELHRGPCLKVAGDQLRWGTISEHRQWQRDKANINSSR